MTRRQFALGGATTSMMSAVASSKDAEEQGWTVQFRRLMEEVPRLKLVARLAPASVYSSQLNLLAKTSVEATPGAVLDLWLADRQDHLLLTWYRSASREKRAFICALLLCHRIEELREPRNEREMDFQLAPERFSPPEATERLEELEYVKTHARSLAKNFHQTLLKVPDILPNKISGFAYTAALTDMEHNELLSDAANFDRKQAVRRKTNPAKD